MFPGGKVPSTTKMTQNWIRHNLTRAPCRLGPHTPSELEKHSPCYTYKGAWGSSKKLGRWGKTAWWVADGPSASSTPPMLCVPFTPSYSPRTVVLHGASAPAEMLLHIFTWLSPRHSGGGSNVPSQSSLPYLPKSKLPPTPALPATSANVIFWGALVSTGNHQLMLVLVSTACLTDDMVLIFCALSPDRA